MRGRDPALLVAALAVGSLLPVTMPPTAAHATARGPRASDPTAPFSAPYELCRLDDPRFTEVSGATWAVDGLRIANDKGATIGVLAEGCRVREVQAGAPPATDAATRGRLDVEDVAVGPDGTTWLLDTGGNRFVRDEVSLLGRRSDGSLVRVSLVLPEAGLDIEAGFVTLTGRVVLLTKERGRARVLTAQLSAGPGAQGRLVEAGALDVAGLATADGGTASEAGLRITGAALSPAGGHLALRTYDRAYEWTVEDGDPVATLLGRAPAVVADLDQPQGEAVTYGADEDRLLFLSEGRDVAVLAVDRTEPAVATPAPSTTAGGLPLWAVLLWSGPAAVLGALALTRLRARRLLRTTAATAGQQP